MNHSHEKVWGPGRRKGLLIIFAVIAFVVIVGFWLSALITNPGNATGDPGTTAEASGSATSTMSDGPGSSSLPSSPEVPVATVPPAVTLPPAEASAKASEDAASALVSQQTATPLPLTDTAKPEAGITVTVEKIEAVDGEGQGLGQINGPAIRFTLTLVNNGSTAILTDKVVVNVESGADSQPAIQLSGPGASPFPESTEPGETSTGTFVFYLPNEQRDQVRIFFNYQVSSPIVAFEGAVPKAQ